jgi:hypothetical protein
MSYDNPRIKSLSMSFMDIMVAFAEGNPGACRVLSEIVTAAPKIDPDSALGALGPLCSLDNLDCYGSRIWMLYKDVCGQNINTMLGLLRCCQMGFTSDRKINAAIDGDKAALDIPALLAQLKEQLPDFQTDDRHHERNKRIA